MLVSLAGARSGFAAGLTQVLTFKVFFSSFAAVKCIAMADAPNGTRKAYQDSGCTIGC